MRVSSSADARHPDKKPPNKKARRAAPGFCFWRSD
jgi:hypothetical protein